MFIIADEDIGKVQDVVYCTIRDLVSRNRKRIDSNVYIDEVPVLSVTGYWVNDTLRIDIRIKK